MRSLTRDEVRAVDQFAIRQLGLPGIVLMENAGRNAADIIDCRLDGVDGSRIAILAGAGNNGGDGYVIARHLANRGAVVVTYLLAPEEKISGDARINLDVLRALGHDLRRPTNEQVADLHKELADADVIIDAIGGTGIRGQLRGDLAVAVEQINAARAARSGETPLIVAIDIPSGLDCDTGQPTRLTVQADLTITFVARKRGYDQPESLPFTGDVLVADIGIDAETVLAKLSV